MYITEKLICQGPEVPWVYVSLFKFWNLYLKAILISFIQYDYKC